MVLNKKSENNLMGVNPNLVKVIRKAAELIKDETDLGFIVTEGLRTRERQAQLLKEGRSKTMNSKHLTGHAVDLAVWVDFSRDKVVGVDEISWKFPLYKRLADVVKEAAKIEGVSIAWGGDWTSFKDGPHFEIDPNKYK